MNFGYNISLLSFIFLSFLFFSVAIWFLNRKQRKIIYYPILKILDKIPKTYPKIILKKPPLIPVLVIFGLGLSIMLISLAPYFVDYEKSKEPSKKIHILVDNSPSIQAIKTKEEISQIVKQMAKRVASVNIVTLSELSTQRVYSYSELPQFLEQIQTSGFNRKGSKLGSKIAKLTRDLKNVDQIVVISDGDKYSWDDFDWQALSDQIPIRLKSISSIEAGSSNLYFKNITPAQNDGAIPESWNVVLARTDASQQDKLLLTASFEDQVIFKTAVIFSEGEANISVSANIPLSNIVADRSNATLEWRLETSDKLRDKIEVDNLYFQPVRVKMSNVLLLSLPFGELVLEDPSYHVQKTLDVLGFSVNRIDQSVRSNLKPFESYPLWYISGGRQGMFKKWCPRRDGKPPQIILSPESSSSSYQELCHCVGYHTDESVSYSRLPTFCEDIMVRDQYIDILRAQGGKQVGGSVGSLNSSLAWSFKDAGVDLLALTLPLRPTRSTGITYGNMPIILRFILDYLGLGAADDGSIKLDKGDTNVPEGESRMRYLPADQLPDLISLSAANKQIMLDQQRENKTVDPIKKAVVWFGLILILLEAIYYFRKSIISSALLVLLISTSSPCEAINLSSLATSQKKSLGKFLKSEVEGRTSISFDALVKKYNNIDSESLKEPWLWTSRLGALSGSNGEFNEDLRIWLRRGGLLVLEGNYSEQQLSKLTSSMESGSWKVVAPDHEIMVSFHLLNSLPECKDNVWKFFSLDDRMTVLSIPYGFLSSMQGQKPKCINQENYQEQSIRIFINILMVALTTDYKKDQVHLPEILKRLR